MPKKPSQAKRVNIYLHPPQLEVASQIANYSRFVQIATDNAASIMAWAILKEVNPKQFRDDRKLESVIDEFNEKYPADPLTQKRQGKWQPNSPKLPDVLS
jgi:hypothetical protein